MKKQINLKTLNDMKGYYKDIISDRCVSRKELKAEAVKYLKINKIRIPINFGHIARIHADSNVGFLREDIVEYRDIDITFEAKEFIKHFFNITSKEDLK